MILSAISVISTLRTRADTEMERIGCWSVSDLEMVGGSMSRGSLRTTVATRSRTSAPPHQCPGQVEGDDDEGGAGSVDRAQFVNAFNGVDDFFNRLRDLRFPSRRAKRRRGWH